MNCTDCRRVLKFIEVKYTLQFTVCFCPCVRLQKKDLNEHWVERKAGGQAAQDLHNFRKGRRPKGAGVAATGECRRGDQKREVVEIPLNLSIRQSALILRSVHTWLPLCYCLELFIYL